MKRVSRPSLYFVFVVMVALSGCNGSDSNTSGTVDVLLPIPGDQNNAMVGAAGSSGEPAEMSNLSNPPAPDGEVTPMGGTLEATAGQEATEMGGRPSEPMEAMMGGMPAPEPRQNICERLGLTAHPFQESTGSVFGEIAGHLVATRLDGQPWNLSDTWTGCESYVFLNYFPDLRLQKNGP